MRTWDYYKEDYKCKSMTAERLDILLFKEAFSSHRDNQSFTWERYMWVMEFGNMEGFSE